MYRQIEFRFGQRALEEEDVVIVVLDQEDSAPLKAHWWRAAGNSIQNLLPVNPSDWTPTLLQGKDGIFYGTTSTSGPGGGGTIFRLGSDLPPILNPVSHSNGNLTLTWNSIANGNYRVE